MSPEPKEEPTVENPPGKSAEAASPYNGSKDPPTAEAIRSKREPFPPQFLECWELYPKRCDHDRLGAYKVWRARVVEAPRQGLTRVKRMENLVAAVRGYVLDCEEEDREERFMKDASTFFNAHSVMAHHARQAREQLGDFEAAVSSNGSHLSVVS